MLTARAALYNGYPKLGARFCFVDIAVAFLDTEITGSSGNRR